MLNAQLIQLCKASFGTQTTSDCWRRGPVNAALSQWAMRQAQGVHRLATTFERTSPSMWSEMILKHSAAKHGWYEYLREMASLSELATFLEADAELPSHLALLKNVAANLPSGARQTAALKHVALEVSLEPLARAYERMLRLVRRRAAATTERDNCFYDQALVDYQGFFNSPFFAIGALYAAELLRQRRASSLLACLTRLGYKTDETAYLQQCTEHSAKHAGAWLSEIVLPTLADHPQALHEICVGMSVRLETSAKYLDRLLYQSVMIQRA